MMFADVTCKRAGTRIKKSGNAWEAGSSAVAACARTLGTLRDKKERTDAGPLSSSLPSNLLG